MLVIRDARSHVYVAEFHIDWLDDDARHDLLQAIQRSFDYSRPLEWFDTTSETVID